MPDSLHDATCEPPQSSTPRRGLALLLDPAPDPFFTPPPLSGVMSAWYGHMPFAAWIVAAPTGASAASACGSSGPGSARSIPRSSSCTATGSALLAVGPEAPAPVHALAASTEPDALARIRQRFAAAGQPHIRIDAAERRAVLQARLNELAARLAGARTILG
jgi:hypothetical protein